MNIIYPLYHILRENGQTSIINTGNEIRIDIPPEDLLSTNFYEKSKWFTILVDYLIREYFRPILTEKFYQSIMFLNYKFGFLNINSTTTADDNTDNHSSDTTDTHTHESEENGLAGSYIAFALAQIKFVMDNSRLKTTRDFEESHIIIDYDYW